jgi:acetyl esterase/lipase
MYRQFLAVALALFCWTGLVAQEQDTSHLPLDEADRIEVYKEVDGVKLQLLFVLPEGHAETDSRPAVIFFFGGGWNGGSPKQFLTHAQYLASRGMVGILADYRVKSRQNTSPFECVMDGKSAVRWVRANAARLGIDPERIAAGGGSAGGHVAAATGTVPGLEQPGEDASVSCRPNALLLFNPVYDNGPDGYGYDRVADRYKEISPMHNIGSGAPPTIVFLGSQDKLIPVATAEAYKAKMEAVGSRCDLHIYEGMEHGFFNESKSDKQPYYDTLLKTDLFLISLGYLDGEPTLEVPPAKSSEAAKAK